MSDDAFLARWATPHATPVRPASTWASPPRTDVVHAVDVTMAIESAVSRAADQPAAPLTPTYRVRINK